MLDWIASNWANILIILVIAVAVFFAIRSMVKDKKAGKCSCGSSCGCGCSGCAMADKCHSKSKS